MGRIRIQVETVQAWHKQRLQSFFPSFRGFLTVNKLVSGYQNSNPVAFLSLLQEKNLQENNHRVPGASSFIFAFSGQFQHSAFSIQFCEWADSEVSFYQKSG